MPYLKSNSSGGSSQCIFCAKATTDDDAAEHVLRRGKHCFATLNLYPYNNGHMMIAPYRHVAGLEELDEAALTELMVLTKQALHVLRTAYHPHAFNIGINQGAAAGAGIADHVHQHIVPRWQGDTSYMTVIGQTRVIPEWIDDSYRQLKAIWAELFPDRD